MKRILKVQEQIGVLGKDSKNPFFKSAYLDLNKLLINVTPLLHEEGLILSQPIKDGHVFSEIIDATGCNVLLSSSIKIPETLTDPQKLGSCITYFRRYTLKSLLAISEVDDDGNLAAKPTKYITVILSDKNIASSIAKGKQKDLLNDISQGIFSATTAQIKKLTV